MSALPPREGPSGLLAECSWESPAAGRWRGAGRSGAPLSSAKMPAAPLGRERGACSRPRAEPGWLQLPGRLARARARAGSGAQGPFPGSWRWVRGANDLGPAGEPRPEAFQFLSSRLFLGRGGGGVLNYGTPSLAAKLNST